MHRRYMKSISVFLIFSFLLLDFTVQKTRAEMIDTRAIAAMAKQENDRDRVMSFLDRQDVRQAMKRQGVASEEAKKRVASLSDDEVRQIAGAMDNLPAGGDALGTLVGAALLVFVILLITDITGLTHVFSFVNHRR